MADMPEDKGSRPVPDPTVLTTDALRRDIGALKDLLTTRMDGMDGLSNERYENVKGRFAAIEEIRKEQKGDTERNVADALKAITKQIDLLTTNSNDAVTALRRDIDALRSSLGAGPST